MISGRTVGIACGRSAHPPTLEKYLIQCSGHNSDEGMLQVFLAWLLVKEGFNRTIDTPGEFTSERAALLVPFTAVWAVLLVRCRPFTY